MKKILLSSAAFLLLLLGLAVVPQSASAFSIYQGGSNNICNANNSGGPSTGSSTVCQQNGSNPFSGKNGLLSKITDITMVVGGIIAVIIIIYAGFQYVVAGDDVKQTALARQTIIYAAVGLIVIMVAGVIVQFVIGKFA